MPTTAEANVESPTCPTCGRTSWLIDPRGCDLSCPTDTCSGYQRQPHEVMHGTVMRNTGLCGPCRLAVLEDEKPKPKPGPDYLFDGIGGPVPCENYGCPVTDIIDGDDPGFVQGHAGSWIAVCSEACTVAVLAELEARP